MYTTCICIGICLYMNILIIHIHCTCIEFLHQKTGETAVQELLSNCNRYKKELKLEDDIIESAFDDYKVIQKKAGETGCTVT